MPRADRKPAAAPAPDPGGSRRDQILEVAAPLFAERGFHGVSIDDLGSALGLTGPALYRYFESKDAVLAALLVGISRSLLDGGRVRVEAAVDPEGALDSLIDWHVSFALENPALITVQSRDLASLTGPEQRTVRRLQRQYVEIWVDAIRALYRPVDDDTARAAAHAVFGLINSTPHSARLDRTAMSGLLRQMATGALASATGTPAGA
ncbi:MAG: TetR/AcrR family transcriptional regulator [Actinomycetota bacterium]|nr:TetR/AcrR family transcriptional regulator [Actinomycetota bacterium]